MVRTRAVFTSTPGGAAMVSRVPIQSARERVRAALCTRGYKTARQVSREVGVSEATALRELKLLQREGACLLYRQPGGPFKFGARL